VINSYKQADIAVTNFAKYLLRTGASWTFIAP